MKLSQLILFRESVQSLEYQGAGAESMHRLDVAMDTIDLDPLGSSDHHAELRSIKDTIGQALRHWDEKISVYKKYLDREIEKNSQPMFLESYRSWEAIKDQPLEQVLTRDLRASKTDLDLLRSRLQIYSNWKYPGIFIRPALSNFLDSIVDLDPLYVMDVDYNLLGPCLSSVTPEYRQRLRRLIINEKQTPHLPQLPSGQIGLIFAWNFFNYTPIEVLKEYFHEIYQLLRPGGTFIFTFNNCSRSIHVVLAEHAFASYTPDWAVRSLLANQGFEIMNQFDRDYHLSWFEVRKPGALTSLRGGQTLARLVAGTLSISQKEDLLAEAQSLGLSAPAPVDWQDLGKQVLRKKQEIEQEYQLTRETVIELEQRQQEQQRLADMELEIRRKAQYLGILDYATKPLAQVQEELDNFDYQKELNRLRMEAVRLKLDRTEIIMRKYTFDMLKEAINNWKEQHERPSA